MTEENVMKKRKTMKYPQYEMINEHDLHYKVVDFIRKYYPEAIVIPGLGELQHTSAMRCDAWQKGYKGGQPDILIANKNNDFIGLAIELKTHVAMIYYVVDVNVLFDSLFRAQTLNHMLLHMIFGLGSKPPFPTTVVCCASFLRVVLVWCLLRVGCYARPRSFMLFLSFG